MPAVTDQGLKVFRNDVTEWVVAKDVEDARAVIRDYYTEMLAGEGDVDDDMTECPPERVLKIDLDNGEGSVELACAEWAIKNGRGFLASSEY